MEQKNNKTVSQMLVQLAIKLVSVGLHEQFRLHDFLNSNRDIEEWTASGKLFQTEVAAAEKPLQPMVAR